MAQESPGEVMKDKQQTLKPVKEVMRREGTMKSEVWGGVLLAAEEEVRNTKIRRGGDVYRE